MEPNGAAVGKGVACACLMLLVLLSACEPVGRMFELVDPIGELNAESVDPSRDSILVGRIEGYGSPFVNFFVTRVRRIGSYVSTGGPGTTAIRLLPEGFTHTKGYTHGGFFIKALAPGDYVLSVAGELDPSHPSKDLLSFSMPEGALFDMGTVSVVVDNYTAFNVYFHVEQRADEKPLAVFQELYPGLYDAYEQRLVKY